jgi:fatty acid desaturase
MNAPGSNDHERLQQDLLRMRTSSPAERRAFLRQQRNTPANARRALMLAGAVYLLGGIGQTVKSVQENQSALVIGVLVAATALAGLMIELGRRGRTRLGFAVFVVGMIVLSFVGAL